MTFPSDNDDSLADNSDLFTNDEEEEEEEEDYDEDEMDAEEGELGDDELISEEFLDDSLHSIEPDLEPTDFTDSLHVSDLLQDEDMPEPAAEETTPATDEGEKNNTMRNAALGLGALGALGGAAFAATKFKKLLNDNANAVDEDDAKAALNHSSQHFHDSLTSHASSGNIVGPAPV